MIDLYLHRGRKLYCVFVDYRKAFDSVRRVYLSQKLLKCTIDGKMFKIIKSMYNNAKSCVRQDNSCSNFIQSNVGVSQINNLSPVLFAIFLNDLVEFMSHAYNGLVDMKYEVLYAVKSLKNNKAYTLLQHVFLILMKSLYIFVYICYCMQMIL